MIQNEMHRCGIIATRPLKNAQFRCPAELDPPRRTRKGEGHGCSESKAKILTAGIH